MVPHDDDEDKTSQRQENDQITSSPRRLRCFAVPFANEDMSGFRFLLWATVTEMELRPSEVYIVYADN